MTKDEALAMDLALEALENNRRTHYYCEDTWYSCPKHEDGCANEAEGDECNCGADKANQEIDNAITAIKQARSAPVQEPVAFKIYKPTPPRGAIPDIRDAELPWVYDQDPSSGNVASMWVTPVKATPPVQEPVAWVDVDENGAISSLRYWSEPDNRNEVALYPAPPAAQRQWVGLTDAEVMQTMSGDWTSQFYFARAIEAKLKEKNNG